MLSKAIIYTSLLLLASVLAAARWRLLSKADRHIAILMWFTLFVECVAMKSALAGKNSNWIYHFYSPAEFVLICLYFNFCIRWFQRWHIGYMLGAIGILFALINTCFFQNFNSSDSNFLLFEATMVSLCCIISFHQLLGDDEHLPRRLTQCWISACYLLFWAFSFMSWGMSGSLSSGESHLENTIDFMLSGVNFLFYLGVAAVFFFYKKLIPSGV